MKELLVVAMAAIWPVATLLARWRASSVTQRIAEHALTDCPPSQRAEILRATADLAQGLHNQDRTAASAMRALLPGGGPKSKPDRDPDQP